MKSVLDRAILRSSIHAILEAALGEYIGSIGV